MCKKLAILLYCCQFFFVKNIFAQQKTEFIFRHITQSDGLLHTWVNSIVQDNKGYIWILTPAGLQRYDGSRFVNYPYDLNNSNYIKNTSDANLFMDKKMNCLWIMNPEIEKLDLQKNKFTLYTAEKIMNDSSFKFDSYADASGTTSFVGNFGFYQNNKKNDKPRTPFFSASFLAPDKSNCFLVDKKNEETWMASWQGLTLFYKKTNSIYTHDYNPIRYPLLQLMDKKELTAIMKDSYQNFWISTGGPLFYKYNTLSKKIATYSLTNITTTKSTKIIPKGVLMVNCFFEDNHQHMWIGTSNGGLLQYNPGEDSFTSTINEENNKQGLHYNYEILCIFQDKEENIWLGTDKGINIFNPYRPYLQSVHHEENNPSSIPKNEIMNFIQAANGDIIAGTWGGGITVYDSKWNFKKNISFPGPYENNLVWSFVQNDDGSIWIGCQHGFIHIYNPSTGRIQTIHPAELNGSTIWCMTQDSRGNIWMGLHDGKIAGWNKQQNKFCKYNDSTKGITQVYASVSNIFFDSKQRCWVSTKKGFKQFDTEKRLYSAVYLQDKNNARSISANDIEGIEEYDDSTLLIGTMYGGLNFFNPGNKTFSHLTVKDGLPANTIHAIKKDSSGYVWFTTDYDLYKFKLADKKFIRLNIEPGTINTEFKTALFYPLQDGRWLTGTTTEMICLNTKNNFIPKNKEAKAEITGFKVFNNNLSIDSLLNAHEPVKLSYKQNFLTIEFALLDFSNLQQINYYYRLNGVDKNWVSSGANNFASYTNLDPGEYVFSVKTENDAGISQPSSFTIIISPPFWQTWWFRTVCILFIVCIVYWLIKRIIKTIRHEAMLKQKIAETEMIALRAQMNPHFIFNCLNAIDNLIQTNQKDKATTYLARFAKLIRAVLDSSKNDVVPFHKEYEALNLFLQLEQFRCSNKFEYELKADDEILQGDYKVPPLLVQPFIENAIHHGLMNKPGSDKKLFVQIGIENENIKYSITDNGVGRQKALQIKNINKPEHVSYGIQISTERIHLYNNNGKETDVVITDLYKNDEPAGTKIEVSIKIYNN